MLLRNIVWSFCKWKRGPLIKWVEAFSPEVIVLMSGDSYFFLNMARFFANMFQIPLVLINTEGYYLFEKNYMWRGEGEILFFPIYKYIYRHYFKKLMKDVKYTIYANSLLKKDYDAVFPGESSVIYTGSTIEFKMKRTLNTPPKFSYLGNLGYRRYETLVELSELLHEINPAYRLNVYGDAAPNVVDLFNKAPYLDYKGLVPYNKVIDVMHQSDILFHVENQAEDLQMSLKYGFTTKIADSISSGTLFCLYASSEIACSRYIIDNKAAIFADIRENLKQELIKVLTDDNYRNTIIKTGYEVACLNHDLKDNADRFKHIIEKVIEGNKR